MTAISGTAKIVVQGPEGGGTIDAVLAARAPGKISLQLKDFFGSVLLTLVSNGKCVRLAQGKEVQFAPVDESTTVSLGFPVAIPLHELVALALGRPPRIPGAPEGQQYERETGNYRYTVRSGGTVQEFTISPELGRVTESRISGTRDAAFDFSHFSAEGVPERVSSKAEGYELYLRWRKYVTNERVDDQLFDLDCSGVQK